MKGKRINLCYSSIINFSSHAMHEFDFKYKLKHIICIYQRFVAKFVNLSKYFIEKVKII